MKIISIIGARPQFIKAAVVSRALTKLPGVREVIVHTGQHYDKNMSEIFFQEMRIPKPHYHLGVGGGSHGAMTGRMLEKIEETICEEKPDCVLVYGDTNSTLAGTLAAVKCHVPVAHVEAGLRSFNMRMPEEINRILTDQVSRWLFCPTDTAVCNLKKEGIPGRYNGDVNKEAIVINTGDVMYDAVEFYKKIAVPTKKVQQLLNEVQSNFYLATVHRAENTDNPGRLSDIISALMEIAAKTPVVLPLHPRTKANINQYGLRLENIHYIDPVGYFDMITLLTHCQGVLTDSGGLQKEAFFLKKRGIILRDETEWVELVETGSNILVGAKRTAILEAEQMIRGKLRISLEPLYGDGTAGDKIAKFLVLGN